MRTQDEAVAKYLSPQIAVMRQSLEQIDHLAGDNCKMEIESIRNSINELETFAWIFQLLK